MTDLHHEEESGAKSDAGELYRLGTEALKAKQYAIAHRYLKTALELERTPDHLSQYALALAYEKREIKGAIELCQEAIRNEPKNPEHFLRLGIVYLIADRRKEGIRIFRLGLRVGNHPQIGKWLQILGHRDKPVIPFLERGNPLNKYLGKLRYSLVKKK